MILLILTRCIQLDYFCGGEEAQFVLMNYKKQTVHSRAEVSFHSQT